LKKNTIHKPAAAAADDDEVRHARTKQLCLKLSLLLLDDCPFRPKVRTRAFSLRALQLLRVGYGVEVTSLVNFRKRGIWVTGFRLETDECGTLN
jgi:hypothetical protein